MIHKKYRLRFSWTHLVHQFFLLFHENTLRYAALRYATLRCATLRRLHHVRYATPHTATRYANLTYMALCFDWEKSRQRVDG
jgi:hypothetical protein